MNLGQLNISQCRPIGVNKIIWFAEFTKIGSTMNEFSNNEKRTAFSAGKGAHKISKVSKLPNWTLVSLLAQKIGKDQRCNDTSIRFDDELRCLRLEFTPGDLFVWNSAAV